MAKYLKKFQGNAQYEAYTASTVFITPNVSYCVQEDDVHFNPSSEPPTPPIVSVISYSASSKLNVDLTKFTPSATVETYDSATQTGQIGFTSNVTAIGQSAFEGKTALTNVEIPNTVTSIGDYAFQNCSGLTSCTLGSGVTSIGQFAFTYCTSLPSVTIPDSVTSIGNGAFYRCSGLTSCTLGSGVTSIGQTAFLYCSRLTSITIPSSVTSIGQSAFYYCSSLTSITVDAATPPTLGSGVFDNTNNCSIYVPCASVEAYKAASRWSTYASRITCLTSVNPVTAITLDPSHIDFRDTDPQQYNISIEIEPSDATSYNITVESNNTSVASINSFNNNSINLEILPVDGEATITVTDTISNVQGICTITAENPEDAGPEPFDF